MAAPIVVLTTTSSCDEAEQIAAALVEAQLAACVQIVGPITSIFRWNDKLDRASEFLCLIKTDEGHFAAVESTIIGNHSYVTPEIVAVPISAGSASYLAWLTSSLLS